MNFTSIIAKAKNYAAKNPDKVRDGIDKAEAAVNAKTGNKYAGKVRQGADALEDQLGVPDAPAQPRGGEQPRTTAAPQPNQPGTQAGTQPGTQPPAAG